jgi:hypothetical protein
MLLRLRNKKNINNELKCEANTENQSLLKMTIKWPIFQRHYINLHLNYERQKYLKNKTHQEQTTKNYK